MYVLVPDENKNTAKKKLKSKNDYLGSAEKNRVSQEVENIIFQATLFICLTYLR